MSDVYEIGAQCIAPQFVLNGTPGYIEVNPQAVPNSGTNARIQGSPAGELAIVSTDGSSVVFAPTALTAQRTFTFPDYDGQLATIAGSEIFTNKTITAASNTVHASALRTTGTAVQVSGATPPIAGQVLTAVSATAANWQTPGGGGGSGRAVYTLQSLQAIAANQSWTIVGNMAWLQSRYSSYTAGQFVYYADVPAALLNVRIYNVNTASVVGQDIGATTGARTFSIVNPTADCVLQLQIQKQGDSASPSILGAQLEFN